MIPKEERPTLTELLASMLAMSRLISEECRSCGEYEVTKEKTALALARNGVEDAAIWLSKALLIRETKQ